MKIQVKSTALIRAVLAVLAERHAPDRGTFIELQALRFRLLGCLPRLANQHAERIATCRGYDNEH